MKNSKLLKRIISVALSAAMVFNMSTVTFASENIDKNNVAVSVGTTDSSKTDGVLSKTSSTKAVTGELTSDDLYESDIPVAKVEGLSDDFYMGADLSSVIALEAAGVTYYDFDGNKADVFDVLAEAGVNYIRVRIWNDPYDTNGNGYGGGNNDLEVAKLIGKRATAAGLKLLVDFHYSDFWADPSKQTKPKAWSSYLTSEIENAVTEFTTDSLNALYDEGIDIGMVQVGNETTSSFIGASYGTSAYWSYFVAGCDAVRAFSNGGNSDGKDLGIEVAVHYTNPNRLDFGSIAVQLINNGVDYDIFATSYYPAWHGTIENVQNKLKAVQTKTKALGDEKKVMIAETGYPYQNETDTSLYSYGVSVEGQSKFMRALINSMAEIGGVGVFYWEPAWLDTTWTDYNKYGTGWTSDYAGDYDSDAEKAGACTTTDTSFFKAESSSGTGVYKFHPIETLNVFKYVYKGTTSSLQLDSVESVTIYIKGGEKIELPETLTVTLKSGIEVVEGVTWNQDEIDAIDVNVEGDYTVSGVLDEYNETVYATIEIADNSIVEIQDTTITANVGGTVTMPATVTVTRNGGSETEEVVTWDATEVSKIKTTSTGSYVISGTVEGFDGIAYCYVNVVEDSNGDNLVTNYSFEDSSVSSGNDRAVPDWELVSSVGTSSDRPIYSESRDTVDGIRKMSIWTSSYSNYNAEFYQEIDSSAYGAGMYYVSIWYLSDYSGSVELYLKDGDYSSTVETTATLTKKSGDWVQESFYANISDTSTITVGVRAKGFASGDWINTDLVQVEYCPSSLDTVSDELTNLVETVEDQISDSLISGDTTDVTAAITAAKEVLSNSGATDEEIASSLETLKNALSNVSYAVKIKETANGTTTTDVETAKAGDTVTITATPDNNYEVGTIVVKDYDLNSITVTNNTFTMPASSVNISVSYTLNELMYLSQNMRIYYEGEGTPAVVFDKELDTAADFVIDGKYGYYMTSDLATGDNWFKYRIKGTYGNFAVYEITSVTNGVATGNLIADLSADSDAYDAFIHGTSTYIYNGDFYDSLDDVQEEMSVVRLTFYVYYSGTGKPALLFASTASIGTANFTATGWNSRKGYYMQSAPELGDDWYKINIASTDGGFQLVYVGGSATTSNPGWIANFGLGGGGSDEYNSIFAGSIYFVAASGTLYDNALDTGKVELGDLTEPVVSVATTNSTGTVKLTWDAVENAEQYIVEVDGVELATLDANTTSYSFKYDWGGELIVYVYAKGYGYNDSCSDALYVLTPSELEKVSVTRKNLTTAKVSWSESDYADGYIVYEKVGNGSYKKIKTTTARSLTVKKVSATKDYTFKVVPYTYNDDVRILGKAVTKKISKVTVGKVAKKTLKGKSTKKGIKLTWKKVSNSTGYIVMRSTKKKSGYKVIKTITKKSTVSFLDKKAKKGKTYYYKVIAYKKVGSAKLKSKATKIVTVKRKK